MYLNSYSKGDYNPGAPLWKQALWFFIGNFLVQTRLLPFSKFKILVLRSFGAKIAQGVRIKCGVRVKFPWKLSIGEHSWIGESVWIDNVSNIEIGSHTCISQGAFLCSGDHDWDSKSFDLKLRPILIGNHVWIAAKGIVAPGARIEDGCVLTAGSLASGELKGWSIYQGLPAAEIKNRGSHHE